MFRTILYLLFAVVLISLVRGIIGIIMKGFAGLVGSPSKPQSREGSGNEVPLTGELKKDPACGTYIAAASSIKETVGGQTFYFCSKQCRDKYLASATR